MTHLASIGDWAREQFLWDTGTAARTVSTVLFSENAEATGTRNLIVSVNGQPAYIVKRPRCGAITSDPGKQFEWLHSIGLRSVDKRVRFVIPSSVLIEGVAYEWQQFVAGKTLYSKIRSNPFLFLRHSYIGDGLAVAQAFDVVDEREGGRIPAERVCAGRANHGCRLGIIHNDLAPMNILKAGHEILVVDLEYAQFGPLVYNLYDVILTFGSMIYAPPTRQRNELDYLFAFGNVCKSAVTASTVGSVHHALCQRFGSFDDLHQFVCNYIEYRSTRQLALCGVAGSLDRFFGDMAVLARSRVDWLTPFWKVLQVNTAEGLTPAIS